MKTKTILTGLAIGILLAGCSGEQMLNDAKNKVAADAVKQYEIASQNGDKMQAYIQACMVSAAYLQAQDADNYKKWKKIEKDCAKKVGLSDN